MADNDSDRRDPARRLTRQIQQEVQNRIQERMERRHGRRAEREDFKGLFIGGLLAGIGVLLLLENLALINLNELWPGLLILAGVVLIAVAHGFRRRMCGVALASAGIVFLMYNWGVIHWRPWGYLWPVLLIFFGVDRLAREMQRRTYSDDGNAPIGSRRRQNTTNEIHALTIFGGTRRRVASQEFEGGSVVAIFGGVWLDLTRASMKKEQEATLYADAMFGGIDIRVPDGWQVTVRGVGILGVYENRTFRVPSDEVGRPHLVVSGTATFGVVVVK